MPSPFTVHIEMPSYLQKYLRYHALNTTDPLQFPIKHDYNILLFRLLTNRKDTTPVTDNKNAVEIILPYNRHKDVFSYNRISEKNRILFRKAIKDDLFFDFRYFVKEMIMQNIPRTQATEIFLEQYGITEDDIQTESFYRSFSRYLQKKLHHQNANKFSHKKHSFI